MTPLERALRRRIATEGPITVAAFMAEALGNPRYGYYMRGDPLGRTGDFITAPEISQMFGELLGLWCAEVWNQAGRPAPVRLVELGPGRGTLMADALRATRIVEGFEAARTVHLVETSPALRAMQRRTLGPIDACWHDTLDEVPDGPLLVLANEFFDALPIHQLEYRAGTWHERVVTVEGNALRLALATEPTPLASLIPDNLRERAPEGAVAEVCPAGIATAAVLAERIARWGGGALIVDYGHGESALGDTLQAVRRHAPHEVLRDPGTADITAHVDFAALARAARPHAAVYGPLEQGTLLRRLGIDLRTERLCAGTSATKARGIRAACRRLVDPSAMGRLFKALAIVAPVQPPPPGFEE